MLTFRISRLRIDTAPTDAKNSPDLRIREQINQDLVHQAFSIDADSKKAVPHRTERHFTARAFQKMLRPRTIFRSHKRGGHSDSSL